MPIDHMSYAVPFSKVDDEVAFLLAAFSHMGLKEFFRPAPGVVGMGDDSPWLWIAGVEDRQPIPNDAKVLMNHVALQAKGMNISLPLPVPPPFTLFLRGGIIELTETVVTIVDRAQVDAFHAAALKAGGTDNGAPGVRAEYHPMYYAAFAISPGGHNIECVTHGPCGGDTATD